jgi:hypothetical protein
MNRSDNQYVEHVISSRRTRLQPPPLHSIPMNDKFVVANRREGKNPNVQELVNQARKNVNINQFLGAYLNKGGNFYVTFGGIGDLILLIAEAYKDPDARIIFFANLTGRNFAKELLKDFAIDHIIFDNPMGSPNAMKALNLIKATGKLQKSQHLSDKLDYDDWKNNFEFYKNKMTLSTDWIDRYGTLQNKTDKIALICPSGSYRNMAPQKFLYKPELEALISIYNNQGYKVYCVGSFGDYEFYKVPRNPHTFWLTMNQIIDYHGKRQMIDIKKFFKIINSADLVCSVDTWLKTYTCLCGIQTDVFLNRYEHVSKFGGMAGDYIFLNPDLWPSIHLHDVTEFIKNGAYITIPRNAE